MAYFHSILIEIIRFQVFVSSMLMRLNDLSCQLLDKKSSKIRKWYSEVVNRKKDRQYNGLKNKSTKHYTEN